MEDSKTINAPKIVNPHPQKVEIGLNNHLSDTGYSDSMLVCMYAHYLNLHWHRFVPGFFSIKVTIQHLTYWRSQLHYLGSDLVRRGMISMEGFSADIRFRMAGKQTAVTRMAGAVEFMGRDGVA